MKHDNFWDDLKHAARVLEHCLALVGGCSIVGTVWTLAQLGTFQQMAALF